MAIDPAKRPVPNAVPAAKAAPAVRPANRPAAPTPAAKGPVKAVAPAAAQAQGASEEEAPVEGGSSNFMLFNVAPSTLTSMIFHVVLLMILALFTVAEKKEELLQVFTMPPDSKDELEKIEEFEDVEFKEIDVQAQTFEASDLTPVETQVETPEVTDSPANDLEAAQVAVPEFDPLGETALPRSDSTAVIGSYSGSALEGRGSAEGRAKMAKGSGGSEASEAAVQRALKWIASRQAGDGGWNFNHNLSANPLPCPDPGSAAGARNGATGMAILPFLGAGQTHKEGIYKETVRRGLYYMIQHMKVNGQTGSWHEGEGSMYSHGIASIVMCEAYAMTHDKELLAPAQLAINFIVNAQDPVGGGWRYEPKQAGDTSVVGWQLMALKSGHMAYLQVPQGTVLGAIKYLDSVQSEYGSKYGYTGPGEGAATTSIGLLCRMYLGWKHDHPGLQKGVDFLDKTGPSTTGNMYYNYYATQVCRHYEGEVWKRWNDRMHDWLVNSQDKEGVKEGSWYFKGGDHGTDRGGRLYTTSMATMMLEVYYRHLPIYRKQAAEEDFPL